MEMSNQKRKDITVTTFSLNSSLKHPSQKIPPTNLLLLPLQWWYPDWALSMSVKPAGLEPDLRGHSSSLYIDSLNTWSLFMVTLDIMQNESKWNREFLAQRRFITSISMSSIKFWKTWMFGLQKSFRSPRVQVRVNWIVVGFFWFFPFRGETRPT